LSCPLLGPDYPIPTNLKHGASIISASQNLSSQRDAFVQNSTAFDQRTSFSIQWFAAESNESLFQYYYNWSCGGSEFSGCHKHHRGFDLPYWLHFQAVHDVFVHG
jgi:hypothetical protein